MWWLIIVGFLLMLLGLMFVSFYIEIDTTKKLFQFKYGRLISARLLLEEDILKIQIRILGGQICIYPLNNDSKKPKSRHENSKQGKVKYNRKMLIALIRSFNVRKLYINIDTGNVVLNGLLFPLFYSLESFFKRTIKINFLDRNELKLIIQNNVARIAWAFIRN